MDPMPGDCDGEQEDDFNQHWSYYMNSGSVMYGSQVQDLGGGQFALSYDNPKYTQLDQYLMGLRAPSEVDPLFLVSTAPDFTGTDSIPMMPGTTRNASGTRLDFTIADVIRRMGPRVPARDMCHWKAAVMIVHPNGVPPSAAQIAKVDRLRLRFESFYASATDQRGSFDTTLSGTGVGTSSCPANPMAQPDAGPSDAASLGSDAGSGPDAASPPDVATPVADAGGAIQDAGSGVRTVHAGDCSCRAATEDTPPLAFAILALWSFRRFRRRSVLPSEP
jgi:hypothetical protein